MPLRSPNPSRLPTPRQGLLMTAAGPGAGLLLAAVSAAGLILSRRPFSRLRLFFSLSGLVIGLLLVGTLWSWWRTAQTVPPIHDITTDTANPPAFVAILPLRAAAPVPAGYAGETAASAQRAAYPDIVPIVVAKAPGVAFDAALAAARSLGWTIVATDAASGRIEATATTSWFGFSDDVVIRVVPAQGGSRIDVRSVSRVGKGDLGANARRVRAFTAIVAGKASG